MFMPNSLKHCAAGTKHVYEFNPARSSSLQPSWRESLPNASWPQATQKTTHKCREARTFHFHGHHALLPTGAHSGKLSTGLLPTKKCFSALNQCHTFLIRKRKIMKNYQYYGRIHMTVAHQLAITFRSPLNIGPTPENVSHMFRH